VSDDRAGDDATERARGAPLALADRPAWRALAAHAHDVRARHLAELFAADPARGERFTAEGAGLFSTTRRIA
jgi:glucose-6-phosphate isomerase